MASNLHSRPDDVTDRQVDDAIVRLVCLEIGLRWLDLGRLLLIPDSTLDGISLQYHSLGVGEMTYRMLRIWRETNSANATVSVLTAHLERVGRRDLVHQIKKIIQFPRDDNKSKNQRQELPTLESGLKTPRGARDGDRAISQRLASSIRSPSSKRRRPALQATSSRKTFISTRPSTNLTQNSSVPEVRVPASACDKTTNKFVDNEENKQTKKSRRQQKLVEMNPCSTNSSPDTEASIKDEELPESSKASVASSPTETSDGQIFHAILREVSREIVTQWQDLGRLLQIPQCDLDAIHLQYEANSPIEAAFRMLEKWTQANGTNATLSVLAAQLKTCGRQDITDKIMKIAPMKKKEEHSSKESEWLKELRRKLHEKYRKYVMKGLPWMGNVVVTLAHYYVDLTVETGDGNKKTPLGNNSMLGRRLSVSENLLQQISPDSSEEEELQHVDKVFQSAFSSPKRPLRVLVEGPAGYGKTTLSAKLCFDHATREEYMKYFDLVLHFPLRNFEGDLEEMLCRAADLAESHNREMFLKVVENPSNRILLVLDGYDEVPQPLVKPILALLQGQRFPHVAVVVTSRPGHFTFERWEKESDGCAEQRDFSVDWNGIWQSRITILGVNKEMKALFIEKHLAGFPENIRSQVSSQLQQMERNKIVQSEFLECPLFLLMIILLATDVETGGIRNLRTPTNLYKSVFNFIIRRYCSKQKEPVNEQVDLFVATESPKPFYVDLLSQFGEFALSALTHGKLSFSEDEVLGCQRNRNILDLGLLTTSVSTVGIWEKVAYEPVHKSLLDFSAAYALWQQFPDGERADWVANVYRLWRCTRSEPLCLIMFAGLMGRRIPPALLDVFKPYAMCDVWRWLRHGVREFELTDSVLSSLTPFLPTHWTREDEKCFSRTQHNALLLHGVRQGTIMFASLIAFLATPMPDDVVVHTALFSSIRDTEENEHRFNCRRLVFRDSHVSRGLATWIPSTINFKTLAFLFLSNVSSHLGLLRSAITAGALKDIQIKLTCRIEEPAAVVALTELIKLEKLKALHLHGIPSGSEDLNVLLRAAANSSQLTTLRLWGCSVDLCHLCGGVQKTWQFLSIINCVIAFRPQPDQTLQANCLVLHCHNSPAVLRLLEVCQVTSLQCRAPLLAHIATHPLLPQHLTQLNLLLDRPEQCRLPHLPSLTVLIFTMTDEVPGSFAVRDFLFGQRSVLRLKGIEIWGAERNVELSVDFVKCVSACLEQSSPIPTCQGMPRTSHLLQLQYFLLDSQKYDDFSAPLGNMAAHLRNKSLSRLDIVTERPCFPDLVDLFSPAHGFRWETGLWGTRSEDAIQRRMIYDTQYYSFFNCYSIRHTDN